MVAIAAVAAAVVVFIVFFLIPRRRPVADDVEHFSFDPNTHMLALIGGAGRRVHQDGKVVPFQRTRTYEVIFGDNTVPMLLYDGEGANQLCARINPGHPVAYVFPDASRREESARSAYAAEQVQEPSKPYGSVWRAVFEGTPSASLRVQFKERVAWSDMYGLLHRLALFVRRSDDLWPAKAQWCQKVGTQVQVMDQRGREDWTKVWRAKMAAAGCSNVPTFDRSEWLASRVRALKPAVWLDASTYYADTWKDVSGTNNHVTEMQGTRLKRQEAGLDGVGAAFNYVAGGRDGALRITKGWPAGQEYTFVHLTKYDGPLRGRIWNGVDGNWLSGHHGTLAGRAYHQNWLVVNTKLPSSNWLMTVDQQRAVRFNAGELTGAVDKGFAPSAVGINALSPQHNEPSDWGVAEVLVFAGNLNAAQIQAVEAYLQDKYGL